MKKKITITPVRVAELLAEGERMPVYVHVIDHPDARVLVDTGMTELHPAVADLDPRLRPLSRQDFDLAGIDIVVNTHLHFDHCGGNHLFAGRPIYVQRRELDDARSEDDYTIREWVEAPGVRYVPVDGELELLPGLRLVPAPGHTRGMQVAVVARTSRAHPRQTSAASASCVSAAPVVTSVGTDVYTHLFERARHAADVRAAMAGSRFAHILADATAAEPNAATRAWIGRAPRSQRPIVRRRIRCQTRERRAT